MKNRKKTGIVIILLLIITGIALYFAEQKYDISHRLLVLIRPNTASVSDADISDAEDTIATFAAQNGIAVDDYPDSLVSLLARNPETKDFVLSYPIEHNESHSIDVSDCINTGNVPLLMQWDKRWGYMTYGDDVAGLTACGPLCLSMAALYVTGSSDMSPDRIIDFAIDNGYCVYGNGSSWTLISEGGTKLGLDVTELPLDENRIIANLEVNNPIICVVGPGDFTTTGHFIVMTGYEDGKIKINDPNSRENSEKLWEFDDISGQIQNLWAIR